VPTNLPSFLKKRAAAVTPPAPEPEPAAAAAPPVIFRARPPELIAQPEPPAPPPQPARTPIFRTPPPALLADPEPAAPPAAEPRVKPPVARPAVVARASAPAAAPAKPLRRVATRPTGTPDHMPLPEGGSGFRIVPLQRLAHGGRWRTEAMRSYSCALLLWFTRGQGRITVAGVTRGFGAHNAVFLPAGTMFGFEMTGQVFGNAVFFPQGTALPLPDVPHHLRFREASEQAELNLLIDNIQREVERDLPVASRAVEHHAGLLSVWLERQILSQETPEARDSAARRLSAAYAALVEKDFRAGRTVAEFAAELGVTPTHLTRSCNAACGRSAHDILADRIFFEARRLLRDTQTPVKDIAEGLGFHSPAYFTRAFQKVAGATPTAFRKGR
jgi:AraC-like DNA-binding protein